MRVAVGSLMLALAVGCATHKEKKIETQVVTFPDGAIVQFNGQNAGRAPAKIILPQDENGQLTGPAVVRAIPNTKQQNLVEQVRVFDPNERKDPVPNQIVIDMTLPSTNATPQEIAAAVQEESRPKVRKRAPYVRVERSKPTQAVGLDRYNPGEH